MDRNTLKRPPEDLSEEYMVPGRNLSGIVNMGNTCFMNAAIQCMSATLALTRYFLSQEFLKDLNTEKKEYMMLIEYYRVLEGLWEENQTIEPISFKRTLSKLYEQYQGWHQHDSHEVLIALLDMLHQATAYRVKIGVKGAVENKLDRMEVEGIRRWNSTFKNEYSFIIKSFYGQYHSEMRCNLCGESVDNYDPFSVIELPVTDCTDIEEALFKFVSPETLDNDNRWRCDHCKELANAKKQITFWRLPEIMIVTLKRFNLHPTGRGYKLQHQVDFPLDDLDMSPYMSEYKDGEYRYELYAVNCHSGGTDGGHYFAMCKNMDGNWYIHNDAGDPTRARVKAGNVVSSKAYILFYRRKYD